MSVSRRDVQPNYSLAEQQQMALRKALALSGLCLPQQERRRPTKAAAPRSDLNELS
jgi:hypothetical protein